MMPKGLLAAALFLVGIVLQVETTATSSQYYTLKKCPFRADSGGNLAVGELPQIVGIPVTDRNFRSYLAQHLCKAMCYKPVRPLTNSDDISNMLEANAHFECQKRHVKIEGDSADEICASFNSQVQKPACKLVDDTIVCIVDAFEKSIYVNIFVQPCALEFEIYVVKATETFGDLQCNLDKDEHATIVDNVFKLDFLSKSKTNAKKKLVFAPVAEAKDIVAYKTLTHAMSAAEDLDQYKDMLKTWHELCGEKTGHSTTTVCQSVTANMETVCKRVRTGEANDEIVRIKGCVNQNYIGLKRGTMQDETDLFWCGLKEWEMEADMTKCVNSNSKPQTPNEGGALFAFISSIHVRICKWGESLYHVFGPVSYIYSWLIWGFWNIALYTLPSLWVLEILRGLPYIASVANFLFSIIKTSMECKQLYKGCGNKKDYIFRSVKLAGLGLPCLVFTFLLSVLNCMMRCVGLNLEFITGLKESCRTMKEESAHLVEGLEEVEKLQKRVGNVEKMNGNMQNMRQHLAGLEESMQQMIQKQQAAGTNNSRVNEGLRNGRGRSADDAKRQGMHVSPLGKNSQASLNSKLLSERLLWQQIHAQALDEVKSSMHTIQKELDPYGQDEVVRRKQERDALMQKVLRNSTSMSTDSLEARGMQRLRPFQHRT